MTSPKVFISATSADLAPARQVVKEALLKIGCHPIEQTGFPPDWRDVAQVLRARIGECRALVHIVGLRYGAEPAPNTLPTDVSRRSYTQMEYDIGREFQHKRGDNRFRVYTFLCPEDFPYSASPQGEGDEQQALQREHRRTIREGAALYETPADPSTLERCVLALREEVLTLRAVQSHRERLTLGGILFVALALLGIGYGLYRLSQDVPYETAEEVAKQLDTKAVASRLVRELDTRCESEHNALWEAGRNGEVTEAILELENRCDAARAQVGEIIRTIENGLLDNPSPIFTEAIRIVARDGVDGALRYLQHHQEEQFVRAERAASQVETAQEALQTELRPFFLQAEFLETRLEWDEALTLLKKIVKTAPQWYEARVRLGRLLETLWHYAEAEAETRVALALALTPSEKALAMNNLANMARILQGDYDKARNLHEQAVATIEAAESDNLDQKRRLARTLNDLGAVLTEMEYCKAARRNLERALGLRRDVLATTIRGNDRTIGADRANVAETLSNLARVSLQEGAREDARRRYRESIREAEEAFGTDQHPWVLAIKGDLATLLMDDYPYDEARVELETLIEDTKRVGVLGERHPQIASLLNNLAVVYLKQYRPAEAEAKLRLALEINTKFFGPDHARLAPLYTTFASVRREQGRYPEAEEYYLRALEIAKRLGESHSDYLAAAYGYASYLRAVNKGEEAHTFEVTLPAPDSVAGRACRPGPDSAHQL